eukprot:20284_1
MFKSFRNRFAKSASPVTTPNEDKDDHDVVDDFSVELNAKGLTAFDFELAKECGIQIGGIHKPLTIIVSHQSNESIECMIIIDKHTLLCQARTHQETKQWMKRTIKKLKDNKLLAQYDGVVFVMLCIAKAKEIDGEKSLQEYHDATGAIKHIDKLKKDVSFRLHNGMKLYVHWDSAVPYTVTSSGQRANPKSYTSLQVKDIKQSLEQQAQQDLEDRLIINGYCRRHNQTVPQDLGVLRVIVYYYQIFYAS